MLNLFFVPTLGDSPRIEVDGDEAPHAIKVLRITVGEELLLADGTGAYIHGRVSAIGKKSFTVSVIERSVAPIFTPELIVIQALMKSDRSKEAIELLTVAGADRIIPWQSDRSIAKWQSDIGDKWLTTSMTAAKQSRRFTLPEIEGPITTQQIAKRFGADANLFVFHESATTRLSESVSDLEPRPIAIVIGPEGGLTGEELGLLGAAGGRIVQMGPEVFRAAHAGFAALSAISALTGRW